MFTDFKLAIQRKFNDIKDRDIFRVDVDKDKLWELYLSSFPEGTNPIHKERTEHDCQCCRQFIRNAGGMVTIVNGSLVSIWDVTVDNFYQVVADALSAFVKQHKVVNSFLHYEDAVGTHKNYQILENDVTLTWEHFHLVLPPQLVLKKGFIDTKLSDIRTTKDLMFRGLSEITVASLDTVLELIGQNSLYRGEEHSASVTKFLQLKKKFDNAKDKELFCWEMLSKTTPAVARIKNTVIGTLLMDLSEGRDLDAAVSSFEQKVAPTNYKRPTALITTAMIDLAKKKIEELGLTTSLDRRFAVLEDISINNVLFADRSAKKKMNDVFDELVSQVGVSTKTLDKIEEIYIDEFITKVLPKAESIEVLFENRHANNLVSLLAPSDLTAKHLFKWPNNFSWSYQGEVADSIKERVKLAGGKVDGDLRCSLSWFNYDDLDLHMFEPKGGSHIFFGGKVSMRTGGQLDVDMNAGFSQSRTPVENICYPDRRKMLEGQYELSVKQYNKRETSDVGFDVEIEFDGQVFSFSYAQAVKESVKVATINYSHKDGFTIVESLASTQTVKTVWELPTQTFHKASVMLLSPNYWNETPIGNKHYFFMLEGCRNEGKVRGFYNEFLKEELTPHRKVFEIVGTKLKVQDEVNQLSGLGFSSTQRNSVVCKVRGSFSRTLKVLF
jgi:hypothetical protein